MLIIAGYTLLTPNNRSTTRIAAYIKQDIEFTLNKTNQNLETLSITIDKFNILGIYRPFKLMHHDNYTSQVDELKREIKEHNIVLGDLNFDYLRKGNSSYKFSNLYNAWLEEIDTKNFIQVNSDVT